jgi:rhodanese-related sulfurtransferase
MQNTNKRGANMIGLLKRNYENISVDEVKNIANDKNTMIIDVRQPYEYSAGHIPGAKLIPLSEIGNRLAEIDKNKTIVVVCASGARSARASAILGKAGYKVYNMLGGMSSWTGKVKR